jgi:NAD(P)-dependent dehydrogenase (short-subunit alcohol dehydrogenase family)
VKNIWLAACLFISASWSVSAMDLELDGKQALVTGSTSGIGYAIAAALLREGADVIVNGRSQETVDAAIDSLRDATGKTAKGFAADMATAEGTAAIHAAFPNVDILINNVGGYGPQAFEESTDEDWYRLIDLNVMSGVRLSRLYLPRMRETNWGRIIFISSESAYHIPPDSIHYGMTKAAQIAVSRGLAEATATTGITVNSVLPGPTRTQFAENFLAQQVAQGRDAAVVERQFFDSFRPTSLIKRFADPDEVG